MSGETWRKAPWIGLWERININVVLLWVVMLGAMLWRTGPREEKRHVSRPAPFKIGEAEARYVAEGGTS